MLNILNPITNEIETYPEHRTWIKPTHLCPCPCCDVDCELCSEEAQCGHTKHNNGEGGQCVFVEKDGDFQCVGYYSTGVSYSSCSCETVENCPHVEIIFTEKRKREPGSRKAGIQKQKHLQRLQGSMDKKSTVDLL